MQKFSISFTLGKASVQHEANVAHSNREFIAKNVDAARTHQNVTYIKQDVRVAYAQLFGQAVQEYNDQQKQKCRRIQDYYRHISDGNREEAFYEIIVQFGDSKTAPCGSQNGALVQQMLDEYMREFQMRNPNLHVFNAVMHLDEASPHLHINFIPFYTHGRKNGLQTGVSMKAALDEMGFAGDSSKNNRLVAWEERERVHMESILQAHGFAREDKHATYAHLTVEDFKREQDAKRIVEDIRAAQHIAPADLSRAHFQEMQSKIAQLTAQQASPYKAFFMHHRRSSPT